MLEFPLVLVCLSKIFLLDSTLRMLYPIKYKFIWILYYHLFESNIAKLARFKRGKAFNTRK
jgi:hypothetical protein